MTTTRDVPVRVALSAVPPAKGSVRYAVSTRPAHGTLTGRPPDLTYTPDPGYVGPDRFTFTVADATARSAQATISIEVRAPNRAPVASGAAITVQAATATTIVLSATDPDDDRLTYQLVTPPAHGRLSAGTNARRIYVPAAGYVGSDRFTFRATDGSAETAPAEVTISVTAVAPELTGITPASGAPGATVSIEGSGFRGTTAVRFQGAEQHVFIVGRLSSAASSVRANRGTIAVALGDVNGDGRPDLAAANHGYTGAIGSTVSVFWSGSTAGAVGFAPRVDFTTAPGPHDLAMSDLDGDGRLDLVTCNYGVFAGGTTVSVLRNTSVPRKISFETTADFETGKGPATLAVGDIDGDSRPDLVTANFDDGRGATLSVLRNESTRGSIRFAPRVDFPVGAGPYGVAIGDLDGDGRPDLVAPSFGSFPQGDGFTAGVLLNTSTPGRISFAPRVELATRPGPRYAVVADFDGDGPLDLAVANYGGSGSGDSISVFRNVGTVGKLAFATRVDLFAGAGAMGIAAADIDRDGLSDLLVTNYANGTGTTVSVLRNRSAPGVFAFLPKMELEVGPGPHGLALDDIDGDGWVDLVSADYGTLEGSGAAVTVLRLTVADDRIRTFVPWEATSGPVTVVTPGGSATSASSFTVVSPPPKQ